MPAKTPLAGDKIDASAASAVPFRPYCGDVATGTRNVSEYMLVLALCLVVFVVVDRSHFFFVSFLPQEGQKMRLLYWVIAMSSDSVCVCVCVRACVLV